MLDRSDRRILARPAGHHDCFDIGIKRLGFFDHLDAAEPRHADVHDDDIGATDFAFPLANLRCGEPAARELGGRLSVESEDGETRAALELPADRQVGRKEHAEAAPLRYGLERRIVGHDRLARLDLDDRRVRNRLAERGLLSRHKVGNAIEYRPRLSEAEYLSRSISQTLAGASMDARQAALAQLIGYVERNRSRIRASNSSNRNGFVI
jgi:hypothetical protein